MRAFLVIATTFAAVFALSAKESKVSKRIPLPSASEIAKLPEDGGPEFNRLVFSNSPYLRQHARNPVDWYPWGDEAFERAKKENKPVFLSVGYSACHWCHVMEHESFEDQGVADVLNLLFICVKVDREERPDVDAVYMQATQLFTGRGGWPNSLFLTPDRLPFYAGTYWPKYDRQGQPGFLSISKQLAAAWETRQDQIQEQAKSFEQSLARMEFKGSAGEAGTLPEDLIGVVLHELESDYDPEHGGFGLNMKFPPHTALEFLLYEQKHRPNTVQEKMLTMTLDRMALGGIHDHVGGGFHRYAVDRVWFLPHFEKMLYDNGQLARVYAQAYALFKDPHYAVVLRSLCDWIVRDMTSPEGSFFSALDADSEGEEGLFYIWTLAELEEVLGKEDARKLSAVYQATAKGNYFEEATGEATGSNILFLKSARENRELDPLLEKLRNYRDHNRIAPGLDDKILTSWNGLMIGGLAKAGQALSASNYVEAAGRAAEAVLKHQRQDNGHLFRSRREGNSSLSGVLDDYVFLARGLLDLHEATGNARWKSEAREIMNVVEQKFADGEGGYFYAAAQVKEELPVRHRDPFDNATPSAVGIAAQVWVRLGEEKKATGVLNAFALMLERAPRSCLSLVQARQMSAVKQPVSQKRVTASYQSGVLRLSIREGWHINGNPAAEEYLIPTIVKAEGLTLKKVTYPEAKVLEGEVQITVEAEGSGKLLIEYQPCEKDRCLALESLVIEVP